MDYSAFADLEVASVFSNSTYEYDIDLSSMANDLLGKMPDDLLDLDLRPLGERDYEQLTGSPVRHYILGPPEGPAYGYPDAGSSGQHLDQTWFGSPTPNTLAGLVFNVGNGEDKENCDPRLAGKELISSPPSPNLENPPCPSTQEVTEIPLIELDQLLGSQMPTNYCNTDLGDFMSGKKPVLERTISLEPALQMEYDRLFKQWKTEASDYRDTLRLADNVDSARIVPENLARMTFDRAASFSDHYLLMNTAYQFMLADSPERAVYLKIREIATRQCFACTPAQWSGVGHDDGCGVGDAVAIDRYFKQAVKELGKPDHPEYPARAVMMQRFTRTAQSITEQAEARATSPTKAQETLYFDPVATSIIIQQKVCELWVLARSDPTKALVEMMTFAKGRSCPVCMGHWQGTCNRSCLKLAVIDLQRYYADACLTLKLDVQAPGLRSRVISALTPIN